METTRSAAVIEAVAGSGGSGAFVYGHSSGALALRAAGHGGHGGHSGSVAAGVPGHDHMVPAEVIAPVLADFFLGPGA
jgi:hypothetical protein